jgi:shikimate kinase
MTELVVVGPCAAGKSTLVRDLTAEGIPAREVAQEHSEAPRLYARRPQAAVVYLAADWKTVAARRGRRDNRAQYESELRRLAAARAAAAFVLHTDGLTPDAVRERILAWWEGRRAAGSEPAAAGNR